MFTFYLEFNHIYLLTGECKRQKSTQEYAVLDEFMWLDRFPKIEESFKGRFFGKIACGPAIYHLWKVFAQQQLDELLLYPATCGGPFERLEKKLLYENGAERGLKPWGEDQHWKFPAISGTDGENQNKLNQYLLKCMAQIKRKYDEKKEKDKADYDSELGDGINTNISSNRNHSRKRKLSDDIDDEQSNYNDSKKKRRKLNQSRGKKETNSNNNNSNNRQRSSSPSPFSSAPTIITSEPPKKYSKGKPSPRTPKPKNAKPKKVPKKDAPSSSDLPPNLSPSPPSPEIPKNSASRRMRQRSSTAPVHLTKCYGKDNERQSIEIRRDQYNAQKCRFDKQKYESHSMFTTQRMKALNERQRILTKNKGKKIRNKNKNKKKKNQKKSGKTEMDDENVCYMLIS